LTLDKLKSYNFSFQRPLSVIAYKNAGTLIRASKFLVSLNYSGEAYFIFKPSRNQVKISYF